LHKIISKDPIKVLSSFDWCEYWIEPSFHSWSWWVCEWIEKWKISSIL